MQAMPEWEHLPPLDSDAGRPSQACTIELSRAITLRIIYQSSRSVKTATSQMRCAHLCDEMSKVGGSGEASLPPPPPRPAWRPGAQHARSRLSEYTRKTQMAALKARQLIAKVLAILAGERSNQRAAGDAINDCPSLKTSSANEQIGWAFSFWCRTATHRFHQPYDALD